METTAKPGRAKVCVIGASEQTIININKVCEAYNDRYISDTTPRVLIEKLFKLFTAEEMVDLVVAKLAAKKGGSAV